MSKRDKAPMLKLAKEAEGNFGDWTKWHDVGGGSEARARLEYDQQTHLTDGNWVDCYGTFSYEGKRDHSTVPMTWPTATLDQYEVTEAVRQVMRRLWDLDCDDVEPMVMDLDDIKTVTIRHIDKQRVVLDVPAQAIRCERDSIWWLPPKDIEGPETLAGIAKRVRDYFHNDWTFCGVCVEVRHKPCEHCGERKVTDGSLWGIETDAGDYFADVIGDLIAEAV